MTMGGPSGSIDNIDPSAEFACAIGAPKFELLATRTRLESSILPGWVKAEVWFVADRSARMERANRRNSTGTGNSESNHASCQSRRSLRCFLSSQLEESGDNDKQHRDREFALA